MSTVTSETVAELSAQEFVLNLTDAAAVKIQDILQERGVPDYGLRVFVSGGGCSGMQYGMALEPQASEMDTVIQASGIKVYVDPASAKYLDGATIDYQDGLARSGFRIDAPNAASACGCGDSSAGCGCR